MENLKRLLPYLAPHRGMIILSLILTALSGVMATGFVWLATNVIEPLISNAGVPAAQRLASLNLAVLAIIGFSMLQTAVNFGQQYFTQRTGQRVLFRLREDLFCHFQSLSVSFFERKRTGEIMSRLTNDIGSLQAILTDAVKTVAGGPIAIVGLVGYMFWANWRLSLFVLVVLPPVSWLIGRGGRRIRAATHRLQVQNAILTNYLQEKISAIRLIQTFGTSNYENRLFKETNDEAYEATMTPIRIAASLAPSIELIGMAGVVASLWFGGHDVIEGSMKAKHLFGFVLAMQQTGARAKSLGNLNLIIKGAEAAAARLWEILDTKPEIVNAPGAIALPRATVAGHIKFDNVRFAYEDGPEVLKGVSFEIKPGQVLALAGLSGSGKTTIAALLPRLYDPTGGKVTLDGHDLRDVDLQSLRDMIGAVPQDVTLFHGSVRDNISYGSPDATLEQIVQAARRANADDFIRALPGGYDSPIGEGGIGFSGGQRQRLAIARALLRDPKLLILDEATSALDAESEGAVQDALAELMKGRTTLIIAHRFSTIVGADQILVMDQGNIIERGTHAGLLAQKGQYWKLYQMQAFQAKRGEIEAQEAKDSLRDVEISAA